MSDYLLSGLLQHLNYHQARRIARTLGALSTTDRIEHWRAAIAAHWADPQRTAQTVSQLPDAARHALRRLSTIDAAPLSLIVGEYGPLRLHRPRRHTPSVAELLYERGLLHPAGNQSWSRATRLLIPADLRPRLLALLPPLPVCEPLDVLCAASPGPHPPSPLPLLHDVVQLLDFCARGEAIQRPALRWFKPTALRRLNQQLLQPLPLPPQATHKQSPYLRLLLFLATAAGLLEQGSLTTTAWHWLSETPTTQWRMLIHAWRDAPAQLRARYTHESEPLTPPAPWLSTLLCFLTQQQDPFCPQRLADHLLGHAHDLNAFFAANFDSLSAMSHTIAHLCAGPLTWLGLMTPLVTQYEAEPVPSSHTLYQLTPAARWLLEDADSDSPPAWRWRSDGAQWSEFADWTLCLPWDIEPLLFVRLARYAEPAEPERRQSGLRHLFRLSSHSLAAASAQGLGLPTLMATLATLGLPLRPAQQATLLHWHETGGWPSLQLLPVLRTANRSQLAQLFTDPRLENMLGEPLNRVTALWHGELSHVLDQLRSAGYAPVVGQMPPGAATVPESTYAGALWLAAQLYTLLGRHLSLPFSLPGAAADALYQQLDAVEQAQLHAHLDALAQELLELLDGLTPLPSPYPTDPAQWRPQIDAAIEAEKTLEMIYWSAGRGLLTTRRVQPYWIIDRTHASYLRAECLASGRLLHFRLDRIVGLYPAKS